MSLDTWKQEFMPTSADEFCSLEFSPEAALAAVQHAKQKWIGYRLVNTKKHQLTWDPNVCRSWARNWKLSDAYGNNHYIGGRSCALCALYLCNSSASEGGCSDCPLSPIAGVCNEEPSIWSKLYYAWDERLREAAIEDMISALTQAEAFQKERTAS